MADLKGILVGCGWISTNHLKAWSQVSGVDIVALVDSDIVKARARAAEFDIPHTYGSLADALASLTIDFVDIATPPASHLQLVTDVADAGLAVLCQKPIAPTMGELDQMGAACDAADVLFMVNENGRFQPWMQALKSQIDAGAIGRPFHLSITSRWRSSLPEPDFGGQPYFVDMPRLMIYEMGVHFLDTQRYLIGESSQLYAQTHRASPHLAGEDMATVVLKGDGITSVIDMSWASVATEEGITWGNFRVEGEKGTLHLRRDGVLRVLTDEGVVHEESFGAETVLQGFRNAQQHFVDCLISGEESQTSGRQTLKTMELVFGAYESARSGEVYRVGMDVEKLK